MKKGDLITGENGIDYRVIESIGKGGQAKIWKVQDEISKEFYACKDYRHDPKNVRGNIEDLVKIGEIKDRNGKALESVVMPITIINGVGDSFGYVMELVDLTDYTTLKKAWLKPGKYPTPFAICNIVKNFALFFERLHLGHGLCYKDVNEGNIFFNPKTGNIKIIDNDNIGLSTKQTIKGTPYYMAPEVVLGENPNANSDKFSFAVFMYRLFTGGYPFEGPYTENYCLKNDILLNDPTASKELLGKNPLFVWHPTDKRNCIENSTNIQLKGQAVYWKRLPQVIKDLFIKTFVTNLSKERAAERTSDVTWRQTFETLEKNLVVCPHCNARTFAEADGCFECEKPLAKKTSHNVTFLAMRAGEGKTQFSLTEGTIIRGDKISKNLPGSDLMKIVYNANSKKIGAKNLSNLTWRVQKADGTVLDCAPNKIITLEKDTKIAVIRKMVQLNVINIA